MKTLTFVLAIIALALPCLAQRALTSGELKARTYSLTVASGATTTEAVESMPLRLGCTVAAVALPAAMTSTSFTISASLDGVSYGYLYDKFGNKETIAIPNVNEVKIVAVDASMLWGVRSLRLVFSSAEGGDRPVQVICQR